MGAKTKAGGKKSQGGGRTSWGKIVAISVLVLLIGAAIALAVYYKRKATSETDAPTGGSVGSTRPPASPGTTTTSPPTTTPPVTNAPAPTPSPATPSPATPSPVTDAPVTATPSPSTGAPTPAPAPPPPKTVCKTYNGLKLCDGYGYKVYFPDFHNLGLVRMNNINSPNEGMVGVNQAIKTDGQGYNKLAPDGYSTVVVQHSSPGFFKLFFRSTTIEDSWVFYKPGWMYVGKYSILHYTANEDRAEEFSVKNNNDGTFTLANKRGIPFYLYGTNHNGVNSGSVYLADRDCTEEQGQIFCENISPSRKRYSRLKFEDALGNCSIM